MSREGLDVTVLTPSVPGREWLLGDAIASVANQSVGVAYHLIRVESPPGGVLAPLHIAHQRNVMLGMVDTEWVATLDDDDLYLPEHFEMLAGSGFMDGDDVDVVYTFGEGERAPRDDVSEWTNERLAARLAGSNCVSANAMIRVSALRRVGGWCEDAGLFDERVGKYVHTKATWEDWDLWARMVSAAAGWDAESDEERCRFRCVPEVTWSYRSGDWERCTG